MGIQVYVTIRRPREYSVNRAVVGHEDLIRAVKQSIGTYVFNSQAFQDTPVLGRRDMFDGNYSPLSSLARPERANCMATSGLYP